MPPLPRSFYLQPTRAAARALLGHLLVYDSPAGLLIGRIVETEAYCQRDPCCHSVRTLRTNGRVRYQPRRTPRTETMWGPPGRAYIYFTYGNHHCLNAVTQPDGVAEAILLRAVEPLQGLDLMRARRRVDDDRLLCAGPGRLCQAFGLDRTRDGADLRTSPLRIVRDSPVPARRIAVTPRIGVNGDLRPWRYIVAASPFLSRPFRGASPPRARGGVRGGVAVSRPFRSTPPSPHRTGSQK